MCFVRFSCVEFVYFLRINIKTDNIDFLGTKSFSQGQADITKTDNADQSLNSSFFNVSELI